MSDLENMIEAVKQGDRESVRALLESDNRLANQRDESGAMPLHYATLAGHRQIVQHCLNEELTLTAPIVSSSLRQPVGRLSICARWVDT